MNIQSLTAFGWKLSRVTATAGEQFKVVVPVDTERNKLSPYTLFSSGRITGQRDKQFAAFDRVPGFANDTLPEIVAAGHYEYLVEQDAEWWCFESRHNENLPLMLSPVRVKAGESFALAQGAKLLLCSGSASVADRAHGAGTAITVASTGTVLVAQSDVLGLLFDRGRDA